MTVYVTATATHVAEEVAVPKATGSVNLDGGNLALRDVISVLNAGKAGAGANIDSPAIVPAPSSPAIAAGFQRSQFAPPASP